ncbi:MAG TPA: hypothetical protein VGV37_11310 [Aliidongia sp.]|uniref:hypothetical protein n=1 Tax=Aliidongia sp. TaxID=1914230 RepID=UPI002DDCFE5A|nr:hypothetical protein [Aliidongia sp.]HEV2675120.1 hypothetical protein [Aliidongia sp.]
MRFLTRAMISCLAVLGLVAAAPMLGLKANSESDWVQGLYLAKERAAAAVAGPRILVGSGSSGLLGVDSAMISAATGTQAINFGTHAGLGLKYLLDRLEENLRPHDVVILALEYQQYVSPVEPTTTLVNYAPFFDRHYIFAQPVTEWPSFVLGYNMLASVKSSIKRVLGQPPAAGGFTLALTPSGDYLDNQAGSMPPPSARALTLSPPDPVNPDAIAIIKAFADRSRARGIEIVAIWPPMYRNPVLGTDPGYARFFKDLSATLADIGIPMLGEVDAFLLPMDQMFDGRYHANSVGRETYTRALVAAFCAHQACTPQR